MTRILTALFILGLCPLVHAAVDEYNIPDSVTSCLNARADRDFEISDRMNPFYLRGDLNGDGKADYAVLISQRVTGKAGIFVCFGGRRDGVRIAAGQPIALEAGKTFDDLSDFDAWNVYEHDRPTRGKGEEIHLIAKETGSGVLSWTGKKFKWTQLGI